MGRREQIEKKEKEGEWQERMQPVLSCPSSPLVHIRVYSEKAAACTSS